MQKGSLVAFHKALGAQKRGTCWVCGIPEMKEIDAAIHEGVTQASILGWLVKERGYSSQEAKFCRVRYHYLHVVGG